MKDEVYFKSYEYARVNALFTAVNMAKVMKKEIGSDDAPSSFKLLMFNDYMTQRFFAASGYRLNQSEINNIFKDLFGFQRRAV